MPDKHPAQRRYPPELRERAVRMVHEQIVEQGGERFGVITRIARQLGIGTESLRNWVNQAEIDGGQRPGVTTEERRRIAELEREVRELRRANEILKAGGCRTNLDHPTSVLGLAGQSRGGLQLPHR
jgi:transposase